MTDRRKFLLQTLSNVQGHHNRDILTIASLMTDNEVAQHLAACVAQVEKREGRVS